MMNYILRNFWLRNLCVFICLLVIAPLADPYVSPFDVRFQFVFFIFCMYNLGTIHNWIFQRYILQKKQILLYFALFVPLLSVLIAIDYFVQDLVAPDINLPEWSIIPAFFNSMLFLLVAFGVNGAYRDLIQRQAALENELTRKRDELRFLQNQVNPHFLFNSLNNLYSSSIVEPEKVSERILQMAELLRYQLSCTKREFVPLQEEVAFLRSYIDIEKRRLGRQLSLSVMTSDAFSGHQITPLIFFPFLENAFKYSTGGIDTIQIQVEMKTNGREVQFFVKNTIPQNTATLPASTGIGIENAKKRLELLYTDRYTLLILPETEHFTVDLRIKI
jgi:sensor histidine kinase YesM